MTTLDLVRRIVPRPVRNFLRDPGATVSWLWKQTSYQMGATAEAKILDDWTLKCHPASVEPFETFRNDRDCRDEFDAFRARCRPGMVLFDAGSHHGFFALAAARFGAPDAKIVAIDASEPVVRVLKENVRMNGRGDAISVVEAAVGDKPGIMKMITSGAAGHDYFHGIDIDRPDTRSVRQITLDGLSKETGLVPTHLKIDVEGFEGEAIRGAPAILRDHRPIVFLELHNAILRQRGRRPEDVLGLLSTSGYHRFLHHDRSISASDVTGPAVVRLVCLPD
jgi:FkbM family methyltransferase